MKAIGELRNRGPLGYRSTSVRVDEDWEDTRSYVPPLVYAMAANRGGLLRRLLGRAANQ